MKGRIKRLLMMVMLAGGMAAMAGAQGSVVVRAKLDSTVMLMGKQTALHLEISQDKDVVGNLLQESTPLLTTNVEVADRPEPDTTDIGNNRVQIDRDFIIQSFDSGVYVIPPLEYVVGRDTFRSSQLTLKVLPVIIDSMSTVHDYKPVEGVPFKIIDWLPDFIADYWWLYVIFLVVLALILVGYYYWSKKGNLPLMPRKKDVPPFEEAMQRLDRLKERQLWQSGQEKAYYTELTDILRFYIYRRFGVNAVEMTSCEIMSALRKVEEAREVNDRLSELLSLSDFVKFAKVRPTSDENETAFQRAVQFVEGTKPAPEPEATPEDDKPAENEGKKPVASKPAEAANHDKYAPKGYRPTTDEEGGKVR